MLKVVCYYRVSTKGQKDRGTIKNQRFKCLPYCEDKGFEVVSEYSDPAVSGNTTIDSRPEGKKLVDLVSSKEKVIDGVVVVHVDRLTRSDSAEERGKIWDLLEAKKIHLYQVDGFNYKHESRFEQMLFLNEAFFANWFLANMRDKQQAGRDRAVKENRYAAGGIPYGLRWVNHEDPQKCHWAVNEEELHVLQEAASLIKQGVSIVTIVDIFNGNLSKYPTKYAKRWGHSNLWAMFTKSDFLFTGIRSDGVDTGVKLFTQEEIEAVRGKIKLNRRNKVKAETPKGSFLLRRLIKCECGWHLSAVTIDGIRRYYRCKRCSYGLRADEIDQRVWLDYVQTVGNPTDLRQAVLAGDFAVTSKERDLYRSIQEANEKRLEELREEQRRLNLLFVRREIDKEQYRELKATLDKEMEKANGEQEQASLKLSKPAQVREIIEAAAKSLSRQIEVISRAVSQVEAHRLDFPMHKEARLTGMSLAELKDKVMEMKRAMLVEELARGGTIVVEDRSRVKLQFFVPTQLPEQGSGQTPFG